MNPATMLNQETGIKNSVTKIPATSSITTGEGSSLFIILEALPETGMEIKKIINDSISTMSPLAKQNSVQLINNIPDENHYIVDVDKLRFKQIVINLLSNALITRRDYEDLGT